MKQIGRLVLVCLGFVFVAVTGLLFLVEIPVMLVLGWIQFLGKAHVQPHPVIVLEGIGTILLLGTGVHLFLSWLSTSLWQSAENSSERRQWKWRWTGAGLAIFLLMFITSIAMTGLIHQAGWLAHEPWFKSNFTPYLVRSNMQAIGAALGAYQVDWKHFPVTPGTVALSNAGLPSAYYEGALSDRWHTPYYYSSDGISYVLRSYGENQVLGGGTGEFDDIVYSNGEFLVSNERW